MNDMTLHEMCNAFGISRRAVQGYERAGLVSPSGKNKRGYLLYDEASQEVVKRVKLFQQMGFTIKEIKALLHASDNVLKAALEKQAKKLEEEKKDIELLIGEMHELIEKL